jgi:hypothetical protein
MEGFWVTPDHIALIMLHTRSAHDISRLARVNKAALRAMRRDDVTRKAINAARWQNCDRIFRNQTEASCLAYVQRDVGSFTYVHTQTRDICLAAVQQNGFALQYVHTQTPDICLAAVQQDGLALQYVHIQTPDICLAAVQHNGYALKYVHNKTIAVCIAALRSWADSLRYVHIQPMLAKKRKRVE